MIEKNTNESDSKKNHSLLERRVPQNHVFRKIKKYIDEASINQKAEKYYSDNIGRPCIPPGKIVKILLLGCLMNIKSIRKLMDEINLNIAALWFLGYDLDDSIPDHSTISKVQSRLGEDFFNSILSDILCKCYEEGLINGDKLFVDSTYIKANASPGSLEYRSEFMNKLEEKVGEKTLRSRLKDSEKKITVNEIKVSRTAPDASIISRDGKDYGLKYKGHFGVDGGQARIITGFMLTPGAVADESMLETIIQQSAFVCGNLALEVGADSKYGTCANIKMLSKLGIRCAIPYRGGEIEKKGFIYNRTNDTFKCPEGQLLRFRYIEKAKDARIYQCDAFTCGSCKRFGVCTKSKKGRKLKLPNSHHLISEVLAYLKTFAGRKTRKERMSKAEGVMSDLKCNLGLNRARSRVSKKVWIQCCIAVIGYNLRKLAIYSGRKDRNHHVLNLLVLILLKFCLYKTLKLSKN
jgi:transposase